MEHQEIRERITALETELQDMAPGLDKAEREMELGRLWGAAGQPQRAAALFRAAYVARKKAHGTQDEGAVNAGLSAAAALKVAGEPRAAWQLAQTLERSVGPTHSERAHVVAVYNELRPPGFRPATAAGRSGQKARKKTKKRR